MKVYKYNKIIYENVDINWCIKFLECNLPDFKCLTTQSRKNLETLLKSDWMKKTEFEKGVLDCVRSVDRIKSLSSINYWLIRGYNIEEAKSRVTEKQRISSTRCIEHWLNKGYNKQEAKQLVSEYQKNCSNISNQKKKIEYWLNLGFDIDTANKKLNETLDQVSSFRKKFWINKSYTEEEALEKIYNICWIGSTKDYWITKLGYERGLEKYNDIVSKKIHIGKDNPQYGNPAPKGSGRGISGYYQNYYFRSLYEYSLIKIFERMNIKFICNDIASHKHPTKKIVIKYEHNGEVKNYIPDFIVNDYLIEVKNSYHVNSEQNFLKFQEAKKYVNENGFHDFIVIDDIDINVDSLKLDYYSGILKIDKGKLCRFLKKFKLEEKK